MHLFLVQPLESSSSYDDHKINLREIEAYDVNGIQLTLTVDSVSFESTVYPMSNTVDGNYNTYGATKQNPVDLDSYNWIKYSISGITDVCLLKTIKVYNRIDCCMDRMVGNYLQVLSDSLVIDLFYFEEEADTYNFTVSCNTTGLSFNG